MNISDAAWYDDARTRWVIWHLHGMYDAGGRETTLSVALRGTQEMTSVCGKVLLTNVKRFDSCSAPGTQQRADQRAGGEKRL